MPIQKLPPDAWRDSVPADLRHHANWVGHRNKVPVHPKSKVAAKVSDPRTWGTFEQAVEFYRETFSDPTAGVGFVITATVSVVAVDLDHMVAAQQAPTGEVTALRWLQGSEEVQALVKGAPVYAELSPGGSGVHIFLKGALPSGTLHKRAVGEGMALEVWDRARYVTVTGLRLNSADIVAHPGLLERIASFVGHRPEPTTPDEGPEPERAREVSAALTYLDPDMTYPEWVKVGMALKAGLGAAGRDLWLMWSREGSKYAPGTPDSPEAKWDSFSGKGVGLGSLLWMAQQAGWKPGAPPRSRPEDVFQPVTPGASDKVPARRIVTADEVKPENIDWLWKGRIAVGMLFVVVGDPGKGKSMMMTDVAARITRGLPLPGEPRGSTPASVFLLNAEDHAAAVVRARLEAAGADLRYVYILDVGSDQVHLPSECPWLEEEIRKASQRDDGRPPVKLAVLDPLSTILDAGLDGNSMVDVRRALDPLSSMGARLGVSPGVVHHLNKGGDKAGIYRIAGSVGIPAASRYVMVVGPDPDDEDSPARHVGVLKSNGIVVPSLKFTVGERPVPGITDPVGYVEWQGQSTLSPRDIARAPSAGAQSKQDEAKAWLESRLASGDEVPVKLLFDEGQALGYPEHTVRRAGNKLGVAKRQLGPGGGWVWAKA